MRPRVTSTYIDTPPKDADWNTSNNPKAGYLHKAQSLKEQSQLMVDGPSRSIQSGMTVQEDIVADRRQFIDFLS